MGRREIAINRARISGARIRTSLRIRYLRARGVVTPAGSMVAQLDPQPPENKIEPAAA